MSDRAKWWGFTIVIVVLIVASNVVMYELGRRSVIQNIEYSILGNETTQTARSISNATFDVTRTMVEGTWQALENADSIRNTEQAADQATRGAQITKTMVGIYAIQTEHAYTITPSTP